MLSPTGFWSYTRGDDRNARGRLSQLRSLLANELEILYGSLPVTLFQDVETIPQDEGWQSRIRDALISTNFIVPIITPGLLQNALCCSEISFFRQREASLGRTDLIFPVHYIDVSDVNVQNPAECRSPEVLKLLRSRQWLDLRDLRLSDPTTEDVARRIAGLAVGIRAALRQPVAPARATSDGPARAASLPRPRIQEHDDNETVIARVAPATARPAPTPPERKSAAEQAPVGRRDTTASPPSDDIILAYARTAVQFIMGSRALQLGLCAMATVLVLTIAASALWPPAAVPSRTAVAQAAPPGQVAPVAPPAAADRARSLFRYEWNDVDAALRARIMSHAPIDGSLRLPAADTQVTRANLPWLRNAALIQVRSSSWQDRALRVYYVLEANGGLIRLRGLSQPIHEINARSPIRIGSVETAQAYLWFFTFFVRGDEGPFLIVEEEGDPALAAVPARVRDRIWHHLRPVSCAADAGNAYLCRASIWYGTALFAARFKIMPSGMVEMLRDEPLTTELPQLRLPI